MTCGVERWEWEQQYAELVAQGFSAWPSIRSTHPHNVVGEDIGSLALDAMRKRNDAARAAREARPDYGWAKDGPFGGRPPPAPAHAHAQDTITVACFVDRMYDQIVRLDLAMQRATEKGTVLRPGTVAETAVRRNVDACLVWLRENDEGKEPADKLNAHEGVVRGLYTRWYSEVDTDDGELDADGNRPTQLDYAACAGWRDYDIGGAVAVGSDFPLRGARAYKQYVGHTGCSDDVYLLHYQLECELALVGDRECADYKTNGGLGGMPGRARVRFVPRKNETPVVEYGPGGVVSLISFEVKACVFGGPIPERLRRRQGKRKRVDANGLVGVTHAPDINYQVMHGRIFVDALNSCISGRLVARSRCDGAIEYTFKAPRNMLMTRTCITNRVQREAQAAPPDPGADRGLA